MRAFLEVCIMCGICTVSNESIWVVVVGWLFAFSVNPKP